MRRTHKSWYYKDLRIPGASIESSVVCCSLFSKLHWIFASTFVKYEFFVNFSNILEITNKREESFNYSGANKTMSLDYVKKITTEEEKKVKITDKTRF